MRLNRKWVIAPGADRLTRRQQQSRCFRRLQIFGVLLVAAAVLLAALLRTNPQWIFPQGWWRP